MPDSPLTRHMGVGLVKVILTVLAVQMLVVGYVFYQSYQGRTDVVFAQRAGCERSKLDRQGSAVLSSNILTAFEETDKKFPGPNSPSRNQAEAAIQKALHGFLERSKIECDRAFPNPGLFP